MVKKCCVTKCNGNYTKKQKVKTFRLPQNEQQKKLWLSIIPRDNIPNHKDTVICERHWPEGYAKIKFYGKERPRDPPSVFENIPPSLLRTKSSIPRPRETVNTSSSVRSILPDEISAFEEQDNIKDFITLCRDVKTKDFVSTFKCSILHADQHAMFISDKFISGCPQFILKIHVSLKYDAFHFGSKRTITSLLSNNVVYIKK